MDVTVLFRFGPLHVPLGRRDWKDGPEIDLFEHGKSYTVGLLRPHRIATHELDEPGSGQRVADAYIPIGVRCDLVDTSEGFSEVADVVIGYFGPLVEQGRVRTGQPHLRLQRISDLYVVSVQDVDGQELSDITRRYQDWIIDQERERPLPYISREDWIQLHSSLNGETAALHESLLMDAELQLDSDARTGVLFAALACEIFVQTFLRNRAGNDPKLAKWLDWADPSTGQEGSVSLRGYYDLGLMLATGKSLKENHELWRRFGSLVAARNEIAHRGRLLSGFDPAVSVGIAKAVIVWAECQAQGHNLTHI